VSERNAKVVLDVAQALRGPEPAQSLAVLYGGLHLQVGGSVCLMCGWVGGCGCVCVWRWGGGVVTYGDWIGRRRACVILRPSGPSVLSQS
jgi:hypothetical protein